MSLNNTSGSGPGGVRSLRAMFENNDANATPDSRGRSPAGSVASNSDKPLSKVRTSFVGVEQSGHLARTWSRGDSQRRDNSRAVSERSQSIAEEPSSNTSPSVRRSVYDDPVVVAPPIETVISKVRNLSLNKKDSDTEVAKDTSAIQDDSPPAKLSSPAAPEDAPETESVAPASIRSRAEEPTSPLARMAVAKQAEAEASKLDESTSEVPASSPAEQATPVKENGAPSRSIAIAAKMTPSKPSPAPYPTERPSRPSPVSAIAGSEETKPTPPEGTNTQTDEPKTPVARTTLTSSKPAPTPSKNTPTSTSQGTARQATTKQATTESSRPPTSSSRTTKGTTEPTTNGHRPKTPTRYARQKPHESRASISSLTSSVTTTTAGGTRSIGGFVKPRPRSPTRPVKLPAHLVAQTASSAAKHDPAPPDRSLSRKSSVRSLASSTSRAPAAPRFATDLRSRRAPTPQQRQSPAVSRGPPDGDFLSRMMRPTASSSSKVRAQEESPKSRHAAPDASFLDRMMRPTASSSSKTRRHEETDPIATRPQGSKRAGVARAASPKVVRRPEVKQAEESSIPAEPVSMQETSAGQMDLEEMPLEQASREEEKKKGVEQTNEEETPLEQTNGEEKAVEQTNGKETPAETGEVSEPSRGPAAELPSAPGEMASS